jgi:hypothetical protein
MRWDPGLKMLESSVMKSKSIPLMLVSGSKNAPVLLKIGAVAGADIG